MKHIRWLLGLMLLSLTLAACDVSSNTPPSSTTAPNPVMTSDPATDGVPSYPAPNGTAYPGPGDANGYPAPTTAP